MRIVIETGKSKRKFRLIPELGRFREQTEPVVKTPQFLRPKPHPRYLIMAFNLVDTQTVKVTVKPVDKKGNPAVLDGVPEWSVDNPNVLALTPAADGLSCDVSAVGPIGDATVTFKGDTRVGPEVNPILGTLDITVTGGEATTVTLEPGTPTEQ